MEGATSVIDSELDIPEKSKETLNNVNINGSIDDHDDKYLNTDTEQKQENITEIPDKTKEEIIVDIETTCPPVKASRGILDDNKETGSKRKRPEDDDEEWLPERRSKRLQKRAEKRLEQRQKMLDLGLIRQERFWKDFEKKTFLSACKEFGTKDWQKVAEKVPTKPAKMVRKYMTTEKRNQNYTIKTEFVGTDGQVITVDDGEGRRRYRKRGNTDLPDAKPNGKIVEVQKRRERNAPIEQWISIMESKNVEEEKKMKDLGYEQTGDYSTIVPNMFRWISELEDHPDPSECGDVDFAAIYRWFALLCEGEAPPDLNPATSLRVSRLLPMLVTILEGIEMTNETEYLSGYRGPFTKYRSSQSSEVNRREALNLEELGSVPGLNPLGFPVEFFANREIPNLETVMEMFNNEIVKNIDEEESGEIEKSHSSIDVSEPSIELN